MFSEFTEALLSAEKSPMIPDEYDIFGKFCGSWKFKGDFMTGSGEIQTSEGEWLFSRILNGTAIQDVFIWPPRDQRRSDDVCGEYASSIFAYDPLSKKWDVTWVNTGATVRLKAEKIGGNIIMTEITEKKMQWIFSDITDVSFIWQSVIHNDNGSKTLLANLRAFR